MQIRSLYIVPLLFALAPSIASSQSVSELFANAVDNRINGNPSFAANLLERSLADSADFQEASILLADLYLRELDQPDDAKSIIDSGLRDYGDDTRYESLDLLRRFRYPPALLPNLHKARIANAARKLLKKDSTDFVANIVLGTLALERYVNIKDAVNISSDAFGELDDADISTLEPVASSRGNRSSIQYESRGVGYDNEVTTVAKARFSGEHYDRADELLRKAVTARQTDKLGYVTLGRLYAESRNFKRLAALGETMVIHRPYDADSHLFLATGLYYSGALLEASKSFQDALKLMLPETASIFNDISRILNKTQQTFYDRDSDGFSRTFWLFSEPRHLTTYNERKLEHFARMVYSDLRFGQMISNVRGWDTEPGEVIVRYGLPAAESTFSTDKDSYHIMSYPEFGFRFMDLAKAGKLTFYSPKVSGAPSFDAIRRAWNDDTIRSAEYFREQPQVSRFDRYSRKVEFDYKPYYFKGRTGTRTSVVLSMVIPRADLPSQTLSGKSGLFLLQNGSLVKSIVDFPHAHNSETLVSHVLDGAAGQATASIEFDLPDDLPVGFVSTTLEIPSFAESFNISSLVIADHVEELEPNASDDGIDENGFRRQGHWIAPNLAERVPVGALMYSYFEVYNLQMGLGGAGNYRIEAYLIDDRKGRGIDKTVRRISRRRTGRGVAVSFDRKTGASDEATFIAIDTADREPGEYIVVIRVTDLISGGSAYSAAAVELY